MPKDEATNMSDHDLLITMHEQIKNVRNDIKDLKDGTGAKLDDHETRLRSLEENRVSSIDFKSTQKDVLWLQRIAYTGLGIIMALQFYFNYLQWKTLNLT